MVAYTCVPGCKVYGHVGRVRLHVCTYQLIATSFHIRTRDTEARARNMIQSIGDPLGSGYLRMTMRMHYAKNDFCANSSNLRQYTKTTKATAAASITK